MSHLKGGVTITENNKQNIQSRKWLLTINNPIEKSFDHEKIKIELNKIKSCIYWCMSDEQGNKEKTLHTHVYIVCSSAVRFSTLKNKFPTAHIDAAKGTSLQNKDYVFKTGKWESDKKCDTRIANTQEEWGTIPVENQGGRSDFNHLYNLIKSGASDYELLEASSENMTRLSHIERTRQTLRENEFKNTFRQLETIYIFGAAGTGKSRYVMEKHGYSNVFRVTDYKHPFDSYKNQDVLVFDEFISDSIKIQSMNEYLDGYPLELPARYANKRACFTKVYLISNLPLEKQYAFEHVTQPEIWNAFLRRVNKVIQFLSVGEYSEYLTKDYLRLISMGFTEISAKGDGE